MWQNRHLVLTKDGFICAAELLQPAARKCETHFWAWRRTQTVFLAKGSGMTEPNASSFQNTPGARNGLQDRGAALGTLTFFAGAVLFGWLYDFGPKINLVIGFSAFFLVWKLWLAFRRQP